MPPVQRGPIGTNYVYIQIPINISKCWALHYINSGKLISAPAPGVAGPGLVPFQDSAASIVCPFNHLNLQFARLANLLILQVYFDMWRAILLNY